MGKSTLAERWRAIADMADRADASRAPSDQRGPSAFDTRGGPELARGYAALSPSRRLHNRLTHGLSHETELGRAMQHKHMADGIGEAGIYIV
jgi:hypothetical protein